MTKIFEIFETKSPVNGALKAGAGVQKPRKLIFGKRLCAAAMVAFFGSSFDAVGSDDGSGDEYFPLSAYDKSWGALCHPCLKRVWSGLFEKTSTPLIKQIKMLRSKEARSKTRPILGAISYQSVVDIFGQHDSELDKMRNVTLYVKKYVPQPYWGQPNCYYLAIETTELKIDDFMNKAHEERLNVIQGCSTGDSIAGHATGEKKVARYYLKNYLSVIDVYATYKNKFDAIFNASSNKENLEGKSPDEKMEMLRTKITKDDLKELFDALCYIEVNDVYVEHKNKLANVSDVSPVKDLMNKSSDEKIEMLQAKAENDNLEELFYTYCYLGVHEVYAEYKRQFDALFDVPAAETVVPETDAINKEDFINKSIKEQWQILQSKETKDDRENYFDALCYERMIDCFVQYNKGKFLILPDQGASEEDVIKSLPFQKGYFEVLEEKYLK
jgi:hypothetical protein